MGGKGEWMLIERRKCTNDRCRKTHRLLPKECVPYKHYSSEMIEDVVDGVIDEDSIADEDYPSESTMKRWRRWVVQFLKNAEGKIRSAAYRILDLSDEFLGTRESLLEELKERINYGWLSAMTHIYINTG